MNSEIAGLAMQFLARCPLKGAEVLAFLKVMNELEKIAEPADGNSEALCSHAPPSTMMFQEAL